MNVHKERSTHIEAISAIETMTKPMHTAVTRNITIAPPVPPFVNGIIRVLPNVRQWRSDTNTYSRQYGFPCRHQNHTVPKDRHETEVASQLLLLSHTIHVLLVAGGTLLFRNDHILL